MKEHTKLLKVQYQFIQERLNTIIVKVIRVLKITNLIREEGYMVFSKMKSLKYLERFNTQKEEYEIKMG